MNPSHAVHWPSTLQALGISAACLRNRHGPCPGCGGNDRFRFDNRDDRGTFICSQGGGEVLAGDGYDLLQHVHGWTFKEAKEAVEKQTSVLPESHSKPARKPPERPPEPSRTQAYAIGIWARVDRSDNAIRTHPYAQAKGIDWHAGAGRTRASGKIIGKDADNIVIPIREIGTGSVAAVQCINPEGGKQTFGPVKGNAFIIGNDLDTAGEWFVVEGWA